MNIKIILVFVILICILLILGVYTYKIMTVQKESFGPSCRGCNPNVWDSSFKTVSSGETLRCTPRRCNSSMRTTVRNNWDSNKLEAMKYYFNQFTDILIAADFEISKENNYIVKLMSYRDDLLKESYDMIIKINSSGWGNRRSTSKTEYNQRWGGVKKGWDILGDLIKGYNLINKYFQGEVSVFDTMDYNKEFEPVLTLFDEYSSSPSKFSDLNSDIGGNKYSTIAGNKFWEAITRTYSCLKHLSNLILLYKKKDEVGFSLEYLKNELTEYKSCFDGTKIADFNIENIDSSINHIYKYFIQQIEQYAGDKYLSSGQVSDSKILDSSQIPKAVRVNAFNNYDYETLSNCNNLYNDTVDNWKESVELLNSMNKAKVGLSLSMINNNIDTQSDAIQNTKNLFWDNNIQDWKTNQEESNYSTCNPIIDGKIENDTSNVSPFNFKDNSNKVELQRKKIQYARKELISSLFGEDIDSYKISEKLPDCPSVLNQENTSIQGWTRSQNSDQEQKCLNLDTFKDEPSSYNIGGKTQNPTQMKAGYIVGGVDNWIANYENIKSKSKQLQDITDNKFNYNETKDSRHIDLIRKASSMQEVILKIEIGMVV